MNMLYYRLCAAVSLLMAVSCSKAPKPEYGRETPMQLSYGQDSFVYTDYSPLSSKPVTVHYYIPKEGNVRTMPILFAMHGAERNASYQIDTWKEIADDKKVIIIAPCFTKELYPERDYQFVGVSTSRYSYIARSKEEWTVNMIESIFDYVKSKTGNTSARYDLTGHSAGSQFSHRTTLFSCREMRVRRIVCSNAGSYTFPNPEGLKANGATFSFPYSIKGTEVTDEDLKAYFALDLTVHLGTADTATSKEQDSYLPMDEGAKAQGTCRYERGKNFFAAASVQAAKMNVPFNWKLVEVPGIAHNSRGMVQANNVGAAALLYNDK